MGGPIKELFPQGFPITSIELMKPQRKWDNGYSYYFVGNSTSGKPFYRVDMGGPIKELFPKGFPIPSTELMKPQRKWENDGK
jgi:hypothetical protein